MRNNRYYLNQNSYLLSVVVHVSTSRQITDVGYYLSLRSPASVTAIEEIGRQKELLSKLGDKLTAPTGKPVGF